MQSSTKRSHREYTSNKFKRPFVASHPIHVTLRSEIAKKQYSLLSPRTRTWLEAYVPKLAKQLSIHLYSWSINSNHFHFVLSSKSRVSFLTFLKIVASRTARFVLNAEKGRPKNMRFWQKRPYSRVLTWGREFSHVVRYVRRNVKEAMGSMPYVSREDQQRMKQTNEALDREAMGADPQLVLQL